MYRNFAASVRCQYDGPSSTTKNLSQSYKPQVIFHLKVTALLTLTLWVDLMAMASKKNTFLIILAGAVLSFLSSVSAHGYVQEITLGSTVYSGYLPWSDPYYVNPPQRIVRKIPGNGPITDLSMCRLTVPKYLGN